MNLSVVGQMKLSTVLKKSDLSKVQTESIKEQRIKDYYSTKRKDCNSTAADSVPDFFLEDRHFIINDPGGLQILCKLYYCSINIAFKYLIYVYYLIIFLLLLSSVIKKTTTKKKQQPPKSRLSYTLSYFLIKQLLFLFMIFLSILT